MSTIDQRTSGATLDVETHWVSEQCDHGIPGFSTGPLVTGVLKFGLVWDLVWIAYVILRWEFISLDFLLAWGLVLLWVNLAPFFIWRYDELVLPEFFRRFLEITVNETQFSDLAKKYSRFYARPHLVMGLFWAVALVLVAWAGMPVLKEQGMTGAGGVFRWIAYLYGVYIGFTLAAPGFMGPVTTLLLIREVANLEFEIYPLHPDQLGGLSNVGYYSIRTTLLFSSGSLFLPLSFRLSAGSGLEEVIWGVVLVYVFTIAATFVYPTVKINRTAASLRSRILENLRQEYIQLQQEIHEEQGHGLPDLHRQLELQRLRSQYEDYKNVRLYPLQIDIILQLAGSILLPLFFLFVEAYIKELL